MNKERSHDMQNASSLKEIRGSLTGLELCETYFEENSSGVPVVIHPSLFEFEGLSGHVELNGKLTTGMTVVISERRVDGARSTLKSLKKSMRQQRMH